VLLYNYWGYITSNAIWYGDYESMEGIQVVAVRLKISLRSSPDFISGWENLRTCKTRHAYRRLHESLRQTIRSITISTLLHYLYTPVGAK
jgi:hypothetical protein